MLGFGASGRLRDGLIEEDLNHQMDWMDGDVQRFKFEFVRVGL